MRTLTLMEAVAHFGSLAQHVHHAEAEALEKAARVVEAEAKSEIGTYQPAAGPFAAWQELADSTKADRAAKGYTANDPLLRVGTLRDSIEHKIQMGGLEDGGVAHIGSDSDIALYQEMGTSRIPARSFLGGAAFRKEHEVRELLGGEVVASLNGSRFI